MSTLKVNRIEPRTGDTVEIVGFGSGGRIVNSGMLLEDTNVSLPPNITINNVFEWTIPKTAPENNVAVFIEIGGVFTRTKSTSTSSGVVKLYGFISPDQGVTKIAGRKISGSCPPSSIGNPRDNWVVGSMPFSFTDITNSSELNLSFTAITVGDSASDTFNVNKDDACTTLTWLEFEGI